MQGIINLSEETVPLISLFFKEFTKITKEKNKKNKIEDRVSTHLQTIEKIYNKANKYHKVA